MEWLVYVLVGTLLIISGLGFLIALGLLIKIQEATSYIQQDFLKLSHLMTTISTVTSQLIDILEGFAEELNMSTVKFIKTKDNRMITAKDSGEAIDKLNQMGYNLSQEEEDILKRIFESPDEEGNPFEDGV